MHIKPQHLEVPCQGEEEDRHRDRLRGLGSQRHRHWAVGSSRLTQAEPESCAGGARGCNSGWQALPSSSSSCSSSVTASSWCGHKRTCKKKAAQLQKCGGHTAAVATGTAEAGTHRVACPGRQGSSYPAPQAWPPSWTLAVQVGL